MSNSRRKGESEIDGEYREILFQYSLAGVVKSNSSRVPKYEMPCPFCSGLRSKESKKKARCSALFWIEPRNCFRFQCFNQGAYECSGGAVEFPEFLRRLNPGLYREYQLKRFHAGTTGGRWNCPHPSGVKTLRGGSKGIREEHGGL
jgi:hypothetical protein